jgi:hypothetical protein
VDLNRLYFDHQISIMRASRSATFAGRERHAWRASRIAGRIGCAQRALGAAAAPGWDLYAHPPMPTADRASGQVVRNGS